MSKIGRMPIIVDGVTISVQGQIVSYKGPKAEDTYELPRPLAVRLEGKSLFLEVDASQASEKKVRVLNCLWGLHHALLKNKLYGAVKEFEKKIKIVGLGCKAELINRSSIKSLQNKKYSVERDKKQAAVIIVGFKESVIEKGLLFILGKSHFFYFSMPVGVAVEIDKTGQNLIFKSIDPVLLGLCVSKVKALRKPEPYKGTGICEEGKFIRRKAGKTKAG